VGPSLRSVVPPTVIFFLLLSAAFVLRSYLYTRPLLTEKDTILIADFENKTGDAVFDETLRQGLLIQLRQSPFLSILSEESTRETLKLMKRSPESSINREIAGEICLRRGLKVFVLGSIRKIGSDFVLTLEAVNSATGDVVAIKQAEVAGKEDVLGSLSQAASGLRRDLGEALSTIKRLDTPLEVTTSSLQALRMHSLAWKEISGGSAKQAIPYFERAIELDPEFASAYGDLAMVYTNLGYYEEGVAAIRKAYEFCEKTSEIERLNIKDLYHTYVTLSLERRLALLQVYKNAYPRDYKPRLRLATIFLLTGDYENAVTEAKGSISLGSKRSYSDLGAALIALGRFQEARNALEKGVSTGFEWPEFHVKLAQIGVLTGDAELLRREIALLESDGSRSEGKGLEAEISMASGRFAEGMSLFREAIDLAEAAGRDQQASYLRSKAAILAADLGVCGPVEDLTRDASDFVYVEGLISRFSIALAACGSHEKAEKLLEQLIREHPDGTLPNHLYAPLVRATVALRQDPSHAIEMINKIPSGLARGSGFRANYLRGMALLEKERPEEAKEEFLNILDNRKEAAFSPLFALAYLGKARALAESGNSEQARHDYDKFFYIWKDADQDLPVLLKARQEYANLK
jgi:tetratricopeptide (TPR) repeat protein